MSLYTLSRLATSAAERATHEAKLEAQLMKYLEQGPDLSKVKPNTATVQGNMLKLSQRIDAGTEFSEELSYEIEIIKKPDGRFEMTYTVLAYASEAQSATFTPDRTRALSPSELKVMTSLVQNTSMGAFAAALIAATAKPQR